MKILISILFENGYRNFKKFYSNKISDIDSVFEIPMNLIGKIKNSYWNSEKF